MIEFVKNVIAMYRLAKNIKGYDDHLRFLVEININKLADEASLLYEENIKKFEDKIQQLSFAYTADLNDTKTEYLKRHLSVITDSMHAYVNCSVNNCLKEMVKIRNAAWDAVDMFKKKHGIEDKE